MRFVNNADDAEKYFDEHLNDLHMVAAMNAIKEMPTVDANPAKRGKWVYGKELGLISEKIIYCSFCMREAYYSEYGAEKFPFCPYCGAKMDEN